MTQRQHLRCVARSHAVGVNVLGQRLSMGNKTVDRPDVSREQSRCRHGGDRSNFREDARVDGTSNNDVKAGKGDMATACLEVTRLRFRVITFGASRLDAPMLLYERGFAPTCVRSGFARTAFDEISKRALLVVRSGSGGVGQSGFVGRQELFEEILVDCFHEGFVRRDDALL